MLGEQRVDDLRDDALLVSDDAWKDGAAFGETGEEVRAHFVADAARSELRRAVGRAPKFAESRWEGGHDGTLTSRADDCNSGRSAAADYDDSEFRCGVSPLSHFVRCRTSSVVALRPLSHFVRCRTSSAV